MAFMLRAFTESGTGLKSALLSPQRLQTQKSPREAGFLQGLVAVSGQP